MKRKLIPDRELQILMAHHLVEAYEVAMVEELEKIGYTVKEAKEIIAKGQRVENSGHAAIIGINASVGILHTAIHDIMEHSDLSKLSDPSVREIVKKHVPRVKDAMTDEQYEAYRKELGI